MCATAKEEYQMSNPIENTEPEIKVKKDKKPKDTTNIMEIAKETIPLYGADLAESLLKRPKTDTITEEAITPETTKLIVESPAITAFLEIFEEKLKKTIQRIGKELDKKKNGSGCDKNLLKKMVKEARILKEGVKKVRKSKMLENSASATDFTCPHCGEVIKF